MKRDGIINAQLAGALARLGHTDRLVVCDAGLPLPPDPEVVDLAFKFGVPRFEAVLTGLLEELVVEDATAAEETIQQSPEVHKLLAGRFSQLDLVPHEELKRMVAAAKVVVRTSEATPYANVILRCGVPF